MGIANALGALNANGMAPPEESAAGLAGAVATSEKEAPLIPAVLSQHSRQRVSRCTSELANAQRSHDQFAIQHVHLAADSFDEQFAVVWYSHFRNQLENEKS